MKVILLENVKRIGSIGEVIDVKRGFARNFLIAKKKSLYASKENIKLLKRYVSENGKILPSRITNVSQKKQRELSLSIKRARNLALI
jgi:ribosomal protein S18